MSQYKRLERPFLIWLFFHLMEFIPYYIGSLLALYLLHRTQSKIPLMAKELGDLIMSKQMDKIHFMDFILVALGIIIFRTLSRLLFFYPARIQQLNLRTEILEKLEETHPDSYQNVSDGQLFEIAYNDINRLRGFIGFGLLQVGNIIIAGLIFIPKINSFNHSFLIALLPILVSTILFSIIIYLFQPLAKKGMDLHGDLQNSLIEIYDGKKTIKNFHQEKSFTAKFEKSSQLELSYFFKSSLGRIFSVPLINLATGISLAWGAWIVYSQKLPSTSLIFFSGFLYLIMEPIYFLSWIGVVTSQGFAAWKRIKDLVKILKQDNVNRDHLLLWGKQIINPVHEKKWNVFIGETGSGKTFLLTNLASYYTQKGYKTSFIFQEPYLYSTTVEKNIMLGNQLTDDQKQELYDWIELFSLMDLGKSPQEILALEVGENGKKISGGQAKRVALIRSLMSDADIYIWDDPFSSVDPYLEKQIMIKIKNHFQAKGKTFILSAHRLTTVGFCDEVFELKKGISEIAQGSYQDLILQPESFLRSHFEKQYLDA